VSENSVKYMPPDGFFGIQILQILCQAEPQTMLRKLMMLVGWGGNTTFGVLLLIGLGVFGTERAHTFLSETDTDYCLCVHW